MQIDILTYTNWKFSSKIVTRFLHAHSTRILMWYIYIDVNTKFYIQFRQTDVRQLLVNKSARHFTENRVHFYTLLTFTIFYKINSTHIDIQTYYKVQKYLPNCCQKLRLNFFKNLRSTAQHLINLKNETATAGGGDVFIFSSHIFLQIKFDHGVSGLKGFY